MGDYNMIEFVEWYPPILGGMEILVGFHCFTQFIGKRAKALHYLVYLMAAGLSVAVSVRGNCGEIFIFGASLALAGHLFYKAERRKVLLYAAVTVELLQICFGVLDSLSCLLFPVLYGRHLRVAGMAFMLGGGVLALALFGFCGWAVHRHFPGAEETGRCEGSLSALVPVLLLVLVSRYISAEVYGDTIHMQPDGSIQSVPGFFLLALQLLSIASLFCILYVDKRAAESFRLRMECSLLEQEARYMGQYVEEAKLRCESTSAFRHDIRNHMAVVRELLRRGKYDQALDYMGELEGVRAQADFPCATGSPVTDILLGAKLGMAAELGIGVSCSLKLPWPCQVSDMDFGIVFANALDNAIQACRSCGGREQYIAVRGRVQGELILIEVENSYIGKAGIREGRGLANMRAVAEKYHGSLELEAGEGIVRLSILLVIPQQPEDIPQQRGEFGTDAGRK